MDEFPLTDAPPFVFVNGKKYVLADTEDADLTNLANEPLPERWRDLQAPPRYLPATLWFYLHSLGTILVLPFFGWIFVLFGMFFCITFLPSALQDLQHQHWTPDGEGEVIRVEKTQAESNERSVKRIVFKQPDGTVGSSYTVDGSRFKPGAKVPLQRSGTAVKIRDTDLTSFGKINLLVALFPIAGLCAVIVSIYTGRKVFSLLRDGEVGKGYFMEMNPTGTEVNGQPMMKLRYRLVTTDGRELETFIKLLNPELTTEGPAAPLLYHPLNPQFSLVCDMLPAGISLDETVGTFRISVWRCVLPFLFCTAFFVELMILCYAIFNGGVTQ